MLVEQVPPVVGLDAPIRRHQPGKGEDLGVDGSGPDSLQALGETSDQLGHREAVLARERLEGVHFLGRQIESNAHGKAVSRDPSRSKHSRLFLRFTVRVSRTSNELEL